MTEPIIDLNEASVYQKNILILSNISITICKGEFVYLIGETGSGKSSLLKVLYADLPLIDGEGTVAGYNLKDIRNKEIPYLRRKMGIVFQDFQLLIDRNVNENLLFVMKATGWTDSEKIRQKIQEVLNKVGLVSKGNKMPNQLSGGEQQRVVIARALLNDPDLILADEPTGNLDPKTSEGIMQLLFDIRNAGKAVLMATHDYSLFKNFQARTLRCESGSVVENGIGNQENNIVVN